jgi:spore germination cell wall hydrolase CwlJ-like protein
MFLRENKTSGILAVTLTSLVLLCLFVAVVISDVSTNHKPRYEWTIELPISSIPPAPDSDELRCMALNIYHEARNQSWKGQQAIALVTLERLRDSRWPDSVCGVVKDYKQFSWFWDGKSDTPYETEKWETAQWIAEQSLYGELIDFTNGANHYHAVYVQPYWIKDPRMQFVLREDTHLFYQRL